MSVGFDEGGDDGLMPDDAGSLPIDRNARSGQLASNGSRVQDGVARAVAVVDWQAALPPRASRWPWRLCQTLKRLVDFVLAAVGLIALAPLFLLLATAILIDSGWPVFYPWRVVGVRGRRFTGYKLRTMVRDADQLKARLAHRNEMNGPVFKIREDPRVTRLGRFLRRYSLDELPQLWSVIVGDMSLVGPRPLSADEFVGATAAQRRKLSVTPGITCLWQVGGRNEIGNFEDWVRLDLEYIERWSLGLDLWILLRTVPVVIQGTGAY
jgi:lipopolysaccharide/colanic/teichoic acid biosynthesis glycosyltransferase